MEKTFAKIKVKKRKPSAFKGLKKFTAIVMAICGFIIGFCLLFTIVGIPFSILMWMGSIGMIAAVGDNYQVSCPHCKKKTIVGADKEDFECKRCKETTLIEWIK